MNNWWRLQHRRVRSWLLWQMQGKPVDMPVVIRRGILQRCPHGFYNVSEWHWDGAFQRSTIDIRDYVDRLTGIYGAESVKHIEGCHACDVEVTV